MRRHHALPFGAEPIEGGVRFRLWAPTAERVDCLIECGESRRLPMVPQEGGWFTLTTDAARPGTLYRYAVGDAVVPDPTSRFQPADVGGPSEVIDPAAYEWHDDSWAGRPWEEVVLYELHVGAFTAAGDYAGIERHLDHLAELGVTAVELMPIADFPGRRNWGYDGVLPFAPDHRYGRPEALKHLVEACHARGLAILLDVVYNHFGPEGNYLHRYAPQFFTERHQTPWGAAINFDGPQSRAVRDFYVENALYWLVEYHFDGLRFDAVHAIADDSTPDILTEIATTIRRRLAGGPPIHLVLEYDRNAAHYLARENGAAPLFTAQWNDDLHHALRVCAAGETGGYYADYADDPAERLGRALAEGFAYQGEASAYRDGERRGEPSAQLPPTAFAAFIQNHDQVGNNAFGTRLAARVSAAALHAVTAIVLLSPQIPLLFMGQEWGAEQPFCYFCDFAGELAAAVRDGRRREFAKFPEFRDAEARARIPDPVAEATFDRSVLDWSVAERAPYAQWLERHRRLLALRAREIVPRLAGAGGHAGRWRALGDRAVLVSWRLGDGATLVLAANLSEGAVVVGGDRPAGRCLYATRGEARPDSLPPVSAAFFLADGGSR
jgi:malto-oligosyltrehalose trehalohydrolase